MKPLVMVLAVLLMPAVAGTTGELPSKGQQGVAQAALPAAFGEVEVTASLAQSSVQVDENVAFWLTIRNRSSAPVSDVTLVPTGLQGYTIAARCWRPVSGASCVPTDATTANASSARPSPLPSEESITSEIKPGQTLAIWGQLRAEKRQEKHTVYATVRWTDIGGRSSQAVVSLGDLASKNYIDTLEETWSWLQATLKDLALPILLAVLAYRFKKWEDDREAIRRNDENARETARQTAEKELEVQRHEAEQERQQLFQTWNQMLKVSHDDATKHYMPMLSAASTVRTHVLKCRVEMKKVPQGTLPGDDRYKHALFYFLLLRKRNKRFTDDRGGFYFKDRVGEELAAACWSETNKLYIRGNSAIREKFSELLNQVAADDLLSTFMKKFREAAAGNNSSETVFQIVYRQFCEWLASGDCEHAMDYLESFIAVVEFEMNKPYVYWYPADQKSKLNTLGKVDEMLRKIAADAERNERKKTWQSDVEAYIRRSV
jgi:hypothetical protein